MRWWDDLCTCTCRGPYNRLTCSSPQLEGAHQTPTTHNTRRTSCAHNDDIDKLTTRSDTNTYYVSLIRALRVTNPCHEHTVHVFLVPWRYVYLQIDRILLWCLEHSLGTFQDSTMRPDFNTSHCSIFWRRPTQNSSLYLQRKLYLNIDILYAVSRTGYSQASPEHALIPDRDSSCELSTPLLSDIHTVRSHHLKELRLCPAVSTDR